ncbi:hypothetical protein [Nocardia beijingensis]|uniref:hypothetical protein n=1 Tax=Nocardia beijingensis TaxID=95162 RepID=UPI001470D61F|nr:hypothetical protein [Nocardia beijingensis]
MTSMTAPIGHGMRRHTGDADTDAAPATATTSDEPNHTAIRKSGWSTGPGSTRTTLREVAGIESIDNSVISDRLTDAELASKHVLPRVYDSPATPPRELERRPG